MKTIHVLSRVAKGMTERLEREKAGKGEGGGDEEKLRTLEQEVEGIERPFEWADSLAGGSLDDAEEVSPSIHAHLVLSIRKLFSNLCDLAWVHRNCAKRSVTRALFIR